MDFIIITLLAMAKNTKASKSKNKPPKSKSKEIIKTKSEDSHPEVPETNKRKRSKPSQPKEQEKWQKEDEYSLTLAAGIYTLKLHQTYEVKQDNALYKQISSLFALYMKKEKSRDKTIHTHIPFTFFPRFQFILRDQKPQHDKCSICQFEYEEPENYQDQLVKESDEDIICLSCSHLLHKSCFYSLKGDKDWIKCPVCSTIYGEMTGDQPPGSMTWVINKLMRCDGYPDVGTIIIDYSMHSGKRGDINFPGTHRTGYLPNNKEGNQVLQLLKKAFDRKLIFTIGRSVTTGRDNQIVWNGIHHKTNTSGGSAYFGYPDETYFDRVKLELAAKGVV